MIKTQRATKMPRFPKASEHLAKVTNSNFHGGDKIEPDNQAIRKILIVQSFDKTRVHLKSRSVPKMMYSFYEAGPADLNHNRSGLSCDVSGGGRNNLSIGVKSDLPGK